METKLFNQLGEEIGMVDLSSSIFDVPMHHDVVQQVLLAQLANARQSIAHTKGRGEVRGGGKKPWKQKGTGRARHASIRSPIWKGGGVSFGPKKERNFSQKVNKKMARKALTMVLSSKVRDGEFRLIDALSLSSPKTKEAFQIIKKITKHSVMIVTPAKDRALERALGNIPRTGIMSADSLNINDLLGKKYLVMTKDALPVISATYKLAS